MGLAKKTAQKVDLYSIFNTYTRKTKSPYIEIDPFLSYLEKYAINASGEQPELLKWVENKEQRFWAEVSVLSDEGKCVLL